MPEHMPSRPPPKFHTGLNSDSESETDSSRKQSHSRTRTDNHLSHRGVSLETSVDAAAPPIPYWSAKRHLTCGNPTPQPPWSAQLTPWRNSALGKLKTANAALILCLNIDVDPPDIVKTQPCAVLECWVDPRLLPSNRAVEAIGANLKSQYEGLSLKIQYKPILDPSQEDIRKCCQQLRRQAKDDAVLFHYNGHGVPKPTASGELWCFNRNYTQYIPVSLQDIQNWLGSPGVYIWDCSAAGHLLQNFNQFAERRDNDATMSHGGYAPERTPYLQSIQLAACAANEHLPSCPELPADVFTSCLTSPIDMALRYFVLNQKLPDGVEQDMIMQLPGDLKDRRTPLGELNWIFIAITDTIAWTSFSRETFSRLYRCDLLVASLFRNFLLAERILKNYGCTPHTYPPLPATNTHPLWATWDLAVDACLRQLPDLLRNKAPAKAKKPATGQSAEPTAVITDENEVLPGRIGSLRHVTKDEDASQMPPYTYVPSRFFADQLTAFEVWISRGGSALTRRGPMSMPISKEKGLEENGSPVATGVTEDPLVPRKPPDQLPIVLQVLLSQPHRLRALILLSQFVDLGPWAVNMVLSIGIFPYMAKLLQAAGQDLRPVLIFIWTRILAVDPSVQVDLYNNAQGYRYFSKILAMPDDGVLPNSSEHQAMVCFILASLSRDFPNGQAACWDERVFDACLDKLDDPDFLLRQWAALCIAQLWDSNDKGRKDAVQRRTTERLNVMLNDESVEVRCAVLYALQTFMGASGSLDPTKRGGGGSGNLTGLFEVEESFHMRLEVCLITGATFIIKDDASPMARKELLVLISTLVREWRGHFVVCAWLYWEQDQCWRTKDFGPHSPVDDVSGEAIDEWLESFGRSSREENRVILSSFFTIFVVLLDLSDDPYSEVAANAQTIVDYIMALLLDSPFSQHEATSLRRQPIVSPDYRPSAIETTPRSRVPSSHSPLTSTPPSPKPPRPAFPRSDTMTSVTTSVSNTLRRTSSFANALKTFANGVAFPSLEDGHSALFGSSRSDFDVSRPPSPNLNLAQYAPPYYRMSLPVYQNGNSSSPSLQPTALDYAPKDVMEALMLEDMERLRARHRKHRRGGAGGSIPSPSNSTFSTGSSASSLMLGLGTGMGLRDVLPLKSTYFDWCTEYFTEPQMRQTEADEPGSIQYNHQVWRQRRNEKVDVETRSQAEIAPCHRWDRPVATLQSIGHPMTMAFHSYDQHLVVANEHDIVAVWDWSQKKKLNQFCNGNPRGTSITSMHIINQDVGGIIMTGSDDGIVRLFRNYDPTLEQGPIQLVSAFRGLQEVISIKRGSGLVMDWKAANGTLLIGGDSRIIKSWDAQTESQGMDILTDSESPVTAIASDRHGYSEVFAVSFANGAVKLFDARIDDEEPVIMTFPGHTTWVQNICPHPASGFQFLSAGVDGIVKLWDLRNERQAAETWDLNSRGLSAFDVHRTTEVFAGSSAITPHQWKEQKITVQSIKGQMNPSSVSVPTGHVLQPPRVPASPFSHRLTSLVFHPTEMLYGVGEPDGTVRILGCNLTSDPSSN
ncbi:raptor N-terminal caspase like domain-containing protein [Armillaria fumosa]|nr:raptor N-terminal caspase like domain-containing protein [Armillaria fumosa]